MRAFIVACIVFLIWVTIGIYFYSCYFKGICTVEEYYSNEKTIGGEEYIFATTNNSGEIIPGSFANDFLEEQYNFINHNQSSEVVAIGYYLEGETEQVGVSRANALKKQLIAHGINENRVQVKVKKKKIHLESGKPYYEGVDVTHQKISSDNKIMLGKSIAKKTLYSDFASETFQPDKQLHAYTLELKNYLAENPGKHVLITGYTDSVGSESANKELGMKRAKQVKNYFVSEGISAARITVDSKGELSPVASEASEKGRQLNRRIVITIQ